METTYRCIKSGVWVYLQQYTRYIWSDIFVVNKDKDIFMCRFNDKQKIIRELPKRRGAYLYNCYDIQLRITPNCDYHTIIGTMKKEHIIE